MTSDTPSQAAQAVPQALPEASRAQMLWWGITKGCPRCGQRKLFRRYFSIIEHCPRCDLEFEREPGYWTGALAINIALVGGLFAVVFVTVLALTIPDIPVVPVLVATVPIALLGPIVAYPWSKTIWMAVDRSFLQQIDPNQHLDERHR